MWRMIQVFSLNSRHFKLTNSGANDLGYDVQIISGATVTVLGAIAVYAQNWGVVGIIHQSVLVNTQGNGHAFQSANTGLTNTQLEAALVTANWITVAFTVRLRVRNNNAGNQNLGLNYTVGYMR